MNTMPSLWNMNDPKRHFKLKKKRKKKDELEEIQPCANHQFTHFQVLTDVAKTDKFLSN